MNKTKLTPAARKARNLKLTSSTTFYVSAAATAYANAYASQHTPTGIAVGLWTPIAFFLSLELLERVPVKGALGWVRMGFIGFLAAVAGWVSYWHLVEVLRGAGVTDPVALYLMPLTVDMLMAIARMAMNHRPATPAVRRKPAAKAKPARRLTAV